MTDRYGRVIDYLRVSVTDRCNLRCKYCMPSGVQLTRHEDVLTYEEMLRICAVAAGLGIVNFKVTGGEPLTRKGLTGFVARLKALPGVRQVTLTTNGLLLPDALDAFCAADVDGVNISLDTLREVAYRNLTGCAGGTPDEVRRAITACVDRGLKVKINTVLLEQTFEDITDIAALAQELPADVRFIELMPIGEGVTMKGVPMEAALLRLRERWPDLHPVDERRGNGPARYFASRGLLGRIGFIDAVSHQFCGDCNRLRLTSTGKLKSCLCYEEGVDLRTRLRTGADDGALREALCAAVEYKPQAHCFSQQGEITEHGSMYEIGG